MSIKVVSGVRLSLLWLTRSRLFYEPSLRRAEAAINSSQVATGIDGLGVVIWPRVLFGSLSLPLMPSRAENRDALNPGLWEESSLRVVIKSFISSSLVEERKEEKVKRREREEGKEKEGNGGEEKGS